MYLHSGSLGVGGNDWTHAKISVGCQQSESEPIRPPPEKWEQATPQKQVSHGLHRGTRSSKRARLFHNLCCHSDGNAVDISGIIGEIH